MFSKTRRRAQRPGGFSLVEVMIVLVIIGLLAGVVTLNVRNYLLKAKEKTARREIATICAALETFNAEYGRYPSEEEGLEILNKKTDKFPEPLMKGRPIDPWGRPYQYNQPGRNATYEVICLGADGREGGSGIDADIVSWALKETLE